MEVLPDEADWRPWLREHGPKLLLWARQWTRSVADAEDVLQEAFVRYWRHQRTLPGSRLALLLTSIRRAGLDRLRGEQRRERREQSSAPTEESWFEPAPAPDDRRQLLEEALQRLPTAQREVVVLKLWGELTFEEIGEQLQIPPNTAASRYRYALQALRQQLIATDCHG